ncbi:MAG: Uma2 family endonuclease [Myxococcales bacterium]|nr:Uma2 family endonuclease [Myxococcales bacterium]
MSSSDSHARSEALPPAPDVSGLVTEDDAPVDNFCSEKQQRLLTESLYSSWSAPGATPFLAAANVGVYASIHKPPVVPDVLISVDVQPAREWWDKHNRCYFLWEFGKPPDLALEIVSDRDGLELSAKLRQYARMGVRYYVVYDPVRQLSDEALQCFALREGDYEQLDRAWFERLNLGLVLWQGEYEQRDDLWLRWVDASGATIPTGAERAASERARAESERARAEGERARAESETARAEKLAARLRALGIDPDREE